MPLSPSLLICRPECHIPGHAGLVLCVITAIAIGCLLISDLTPLWLYVLIAAVVLEFLYGIFRIREFRPFTLDRDDKDCFCINEGCGLMSISDVRWQDFGYLAVLHYCRGGRVRTAVWWLIWMPEPQRRQLRLWMNAPATAESNELPSILVNPVL